MSIHNMIGSLLSSSWCLRGGSLGYLLLGPPVVPIYPFLGEGSPLKKTTEKMGTLILTSRLEDLDYTGKWIHWVRYLHTVGRFGDFCSAGERQGELPYVAIKDFQAWSGPLRGLSRRICLLRLFASNGYYCGWTISCTTQETLE